MSKPPLMSGPIPPYSNLPIEEQNYKPRRYVISNISLGQQTTVTTTTDMDYAIGQLVRLIIPEPYGCYQLNGKTGTVIDIPASNQVVITIDSSRNIDPFTSSTFTTQPQILAIGDFNSGVINNSGRVSNGTYIQGSFINIS